MYRSSIFYSPSNKVLNDVITDVAASLGTEVIESYLYASDLDKALHDKDGFVGIEFEDNLINIVDLPLEFNIALRFPLHFRSKKTLIRSWQPNLFFKTYESAESSPYDYEGYLVVQAKLYEALLQRKNYSLLVPQISVRAFPEQMYMDFSYLTPLYNHLTTYFTFIYMAPCLIIGQQIVSEKQRHLREIMRIMGLPVTLNWVSWFIVSYLLYFVPAIVVVCVMKWCMCPASNFLVLLLIFIIYIFTLVCFTFMITAFVTSTVMSMTSLFLTQLLSYLPFLMLGARHKNSMAIIVSLFMNSAMPSIFYQIHSFEMRGTGLQWKNMFKYSHPDDEMTIGTTMMVMLFTNVFRVLIGLYVDQLNPGEFGVAKKWYYPCQKSFWCPWRRYGPRFQDEEQVFHPSVSGKSEIFDTETIRNKKVILEAHNLSKSYGDNEVVHDFSMKFFENEITVMLGHNESGKTTALMMLAGITAPTSGIVTLEGLDLPTARQTGQYSLSICPQHNILFDELSAYWHIVFYSRLKGFEQAEAEAEAEKYLAIMNLLDKSTIRVEYLTTGMKRKLSVCCALCGNTKVVLCDEPTGGLDPCARRDVWNMLRMEKTGRCILMVTHFMEAAEVLADRLAIMRDGHVYCYGTEEKVISSLGPGYRLVCVADENCNADEVTDFLKDNIPNVELENIVGSELTYRLPVQHVHKFTNLFKALESQMDTLKLSSFGVSAPTLRETFLKISGHTVERRSKLGEGDSDDSWVTKPMANRELKRSKKNLNDWHALMFKKCRHTRNHAILYTLIILMPLIELMLFTVMHLVYQQDFLVELDPTDLSNYNNPIVLKEMLVPADEDPHDYYLINNRKIAVAYENIAMDAGATVISVVQETLSQYILNNTRLDEEGFTETYVAAATFDDTIRTWFNRRMNHGAGLSHGLIYRAVAYAMAGMDIRIVNKPRADSDMSVLLTHSDRLARTYSNCLCAYLCFAVSAFVLLPVYEKASHLRHVQIMNGISLWSYWLASFVWDLCMFMLIITTVLLSLYRHPADTLCWISLFLLLFGISALIFTYLLSFLFKDPGRGMAYVLLFYCTIVFLAAFLIPLRNDSVYKHFHNLLMILPLYSLYGAVLFLLTNSSVNTNCHEVEWKSFCELHNRCCDVAALDIYNFLVCLIIGPIIFFILLMLASRALPLRYAIKCRSRECSLRDNDDNVYHARMDIDILVKNEDELKACSLVCRRITKKYRRYVAVNCVSLQVNPYECFGLLGPNGAGKTSTLNMIAGIKIISDGDIYIKGVNIKKLTKQGLLNIGFCPQKNILLNYMTGRDMLKFTALSCGIKKDFIPVIIGKLAERFVLTKSLDLKIRHYSVGTKRKLNIAMAVLAHALVCLDEPTAGVDISAQEEIWVVLSDMRERGRALLLTSHNMQECEKVCSCLAIMVNGSLQCYGSVQQIKHYYDKGITIRIQVATELEMLLGSEDSSSHESEVEIEKEASESTMNSETRWMSKMTVLSTEDDVNTKGTQTNLKKRKKTTLTVPISTEDSTDYVKKSTSTLIRQKSSSLFSRSWAYDSHISTNEFTDYVELIRNVEAKFKADFPDCYIIESYSYRGYVVIVIPDKDVKWSTIFRYVEQKRNSLQIKHYSISETSLEDIFIDFANQQDSE
ncbi:phospholipid-transporting ATPase ABCA1 isoform X2 [Drosophila mojavensis]|uniref:phospholipid-transporting ATPase ABCA1 isoform X2 n=1 Tax=Drosophila mojavensis TaxID=7230 RepID=UPI001CD123D0|nr:phospholipid-transporting ATPase ABCA1 isoform X2 [Drosophila mojavensis]